jgi:hypothetical protein
MKIIITESKIKDAIIKFLDIHVVPDYGWDDEKYYKKEIEDIGYIDFYVNDDLLFTYFVKFEGRNPKTLELVTSLSKQLNSFFGKYWIPVFKEWFEKNTSLDVKQLYLINHPFPPLVINLNEAQSKRTGIINCEKCNHSWKIEKNDDFPLLCHGCGYDNKIKKYNPKELAKFWKNNLNESKKDPFSLSKKHMKSLIDTGKKQMGYSEEQSKEEIESIIQSIKKLPSEIKLFRIIKADDRKDINTKTPGSHYAKNKKDLMSGHSFADGSGDNSFMITVLASKELIDIDETIHNNLLYPNENEVTLKNKGEGVKIVSITKISNRTEKINENDLSRTNSLIISVFKKGYNISEIKTMTGFDYNVIIDALRYEKTIDNIGDCTELNRILLNVLWKTNFIKKSYVYDDGSTLGVLYASFSGTLDFVYINKRNIHISGYATPFWDDCTIPVDLQDFNGKGNFDEINLGEIELSNEEILQASTYDEVIKWFNERYYILLKTFIDGKENEFMN